MQRRELIAHAAGALPAWLHGMTTLLRAALATGTVGADAGSASCRAAGDSAAAS